MTYQKAISQIALMALDLENQKVRIMRLKKTEQEKSVLMADADKKIIALNLAIATIKGCL